MIYRQEVRDLIEDLAWKGFNCQDLRWNQFVVAPNALPCPRHLYKHQLNLVDFVETDRASLNDEDRKYAETCMLKRTFGDLCFWGIYPD